ncbi:MAG: DUF3565 domain-containing protein [Myxococcales bacterium]|jgi:tellurite resistance-related uncharacterized protein
MRRHPALQALSRDHHTALVLGRGLQQDTPESLRGGLPAGGAALVNEVRARFERELLPHFALEERELLPLSDCASTELREHAKTIREHHARIRAAISELDAHALQPRADALGKLLTEHVRFEERTWFPALEAALDDSTLDALERRLRFEPLALIVDYHRDEDGVWVADLDCGHGRHIRHQPPFQNAAWVTTAAGRTEKLGAPLPCVLCRMPRMPPCARVYRSTPTYDARSVPAGLLRRHTLAAGTWGRIQVHTGRVAYVLEDEGDLTLVLRPGVPGTVAPERPHHIEPQPGAELHVDFLRVENA